MVTSICACKPADVQAPAWAKSKEPATIFLDTNTVVFYSEAEVIPVKLVMAPNQFRDETVTVRIEEWREPCGCAQGPFIATINSVPDLDIGLLPEDAAKVQQAVTRMLNLLREVGA